MSHTDNPAGRLLLVLQKSQKIDNEKKTNQAFAEIFDVDPKDRSEILHKLGLVNQLPYKIRKQVLSLEINHNLFLKNLNKVEAAFSNINFAANWKRFKDSIDGETLLSLEHCSEVLSNELEEKDLDENDIESLKDKVNEFKDELSNYQIDPVLSRLIFEKLNDIERAIFDYRLSGTVLIQKEVDAAITNALMRVDLLEKDKETSKKWIDFLHNLSVTIHLSETGFALTQYATKLLS